jgi:hypothetical protein
LLAFLQLPRLTSADVLVGQRLAEALWRRGDGAAQQQRQFRDERLAEDATLRGQRVSSGKGLMPSAVRT